MVKKTYIAPAFDVEEAETEQALMTMSTLGTTDATSGNLGRELDFDDEEE